MYLFSYLSLLFLKYFYLPYLTKLLPAKCAGSLSYHRQVL